MPLAVANASYHHTRQVPQNKLVVKSVEIVRYSKKNTHKTEAECPAWNLTKEQLTRVIKEGRFMDGHEFHYYFSVLPCSYEGEVIINETLRYNFQVNAGSYAILSKTGTTLFMAYDKNDIPFIDRRAAPEE